MQSHKAAMRALISHNFICPRVLPDLPRLHSDLCLLSALISRKQCCKSPVLH
jgi:hypothetical protein